jgi:hypothetical protein
VTKFERQGTKGNEVTERQSFRKQGKTGKEETGFGAFDEYHPSR